MKSKTKNIKNKIVAWLLVGSMVMGICPLPALTTQATTSATLVEENTGDMNIVPYNNPNITDAVASGGWAVPVVADFNGDNVLDILLGSATASYSGTMLFLGKEGTHDDSSENTYMQMENGYVITKNNQPFGTSNYEYNQETKLYGDYKNTFVVMSATLLGTAEAFPGGSGGYGNSLPLWNSSTAQTYINLLKDAGQEVYTIPGTATGTITGHSHGFADYDGDGVQDYIYSVDSWGENGWRYGQPHRYNENGVWGDGDDPARCWTFWHKNNGTSLKSSECDFGEAQLVVVYDYVINEDGTKTIIEDSKKPLDAWGLSQPQFMDWDNDGDLDIIGSGFLDYVTYNENVGTAQAPIYLQERPLKVEAEDGKLADLEMEECNLAITSADWNQDGYMDVVIAVEDGRVALIENTGKVDKETNTPIMKDAKFFQMPAEGLKGGMECSPFSVDWDGDGDEDILVGNSYGYICFTENLSIIQKDGKNVQVRDLADPSWALPVPLRTPDGEIYRIQARDNIVGDIYGGGSPQGTSEDCWGYTTFSVGDWDGDGVRDIISNNIWGKVFFHKGIAGDNFHVEEAQPIEVEWQDTDGDGTADPKFPKWNWWKPEGKELVTVWRTTPFMIDLPLDKDGDGIATGDGLMDLVMLDHEGYLSFFERYQSSDGTLKLKENKRIFKDASTGGALRLRTGTNGENGRVKFTMTDYDGDGTLDIIHTDDAGARNVALRKNVSKVQGEYIFSEANMLHERQIYNHSVSPTVCDWNQDGIPDLLMGAEDGHVYYLKNQRTKETEDDGENTRNIADYLVAHWDFDGDEPLKDKATAGSTTDDLTAYADPDSTDTLATDIVIENGVATIKDHASLRSPEEQAGVTTDLDINQKLTFFMKMKTNDIDGWYMLAGKDDAKKNKYAYSFAMAGTYYGTNFAIENNHFSYVAYPKDAWRELIGVVDYDEAGDMVVSVYMSKGTSTANAEDYVLVCTKKREGRTAIVTNDSPFIIGNVTGINTGDSTTSTRQFDDIRIYNDALTLEEISTILPDNSIEEALVAHWDFEDDGNDNALKDKATGGSTADNLTAYADPASPDTLASDIVIADGVATIKNDASLRAGDSPDLDINGEMTMFMRMQTDDVKNWYTLIGKNNATSTWAYQFLMAGQGDYNGVCFVNNNANRYPKPNIGYPKDAWREVAVVVNYNDAGDMVIRMYMSNSTSTESGSDYTQFYEKTVTGTTAQITNNVDFIIGNVKDVNTDLSTTSTRQFDDIRLYSKALTTEQMAGLIDDNKYENGLVAHWDFAGDDEATQLSDKGSGMNPLIIGNDVSISDGVATIRDNGYLKAAAEGLNLTDSMTVFARVKIDKIGNNWGTLLSKYNDAGSKMDASHGYAVSLYPTAAGLMAAFKQNLFMNYTLVNNEWREIALVFEKGEDGFFTNTIMVSKNEGTRDADDFVTYYSFKTPFAIHVSENQPLFIGNNRAAEQTSAVRMFDDVQIYNRALSADELADLIDAQGYDSTSCFLKSLDNNAGFTYLENLTNFTAETTKESIVLAPVAEDDSAVIKVNDKVVSSGAETNIALQEGKNPTIEITVEVGQKSRTYKVNITRNVVSSVKLAALVEAVDGYENTGYDAWDEYETALENAKAVVGLSNPDESEAAQFYNALVTAERALFSQDDLPAVSLKGFKHVTLEDFGLESKNYTEGVGGGLSADNLDNTVISMKVDFETTGHANNCIYMGGDLMLYPASGSVIRLHTLGFGHIPAFYDAIDLSQAGIASSLNEFLLQISFDFKDYDGDGADDGMQIIMYANGAMVYTKEVTGCKLNKLNSVLEPSLGENCSFTLTSVKGDAHGDGILNVKDLVAVRKKTKGIELDATYENIFADVNHDTVYNDADAVAIREKLVQ